MSWHYQQSRHRGTREEQDLRGLLRSVIGENGSLHSGSIRNSLVRVDALAGLLPVKELGEKFDNVRNRSGSTDEDDLVHL